jgi:hypothetical protein
VTAEAVAKARPMTRKAPNLTESNPQLERVVDATPPGMAHWAGTGPGGTTCGDCRSYGYDPEWKFPCVVRPNSCRRFFQLMAYHGPALPPETPSCKHFQPRERRGKR